MKPVTVQKVFEGATVTKNEAATSGAIDITNVTPNGLFALHITKQTGGTVTYTYTMCNTKDGTFIAPSGASDIKANNATGTTDIVSFDPEVAKFIKIVATEQNVTAVTDLDAEVAMQ